MTEQSILSDSQNAPVIHLEVEPKSAQIKAGETVTLLWRAEHVEQLYLLPSLTGRGGMFKAPRIQWAQLDQLGEKVALQDKATLIPQVTTTYVLAGVRQGDTCYRCVTIDVLTEPAQTPKPLTWYAWHEDADRWYREEALYDTTSCYRLTPIIDLTLRDRVLYLGEDNRLEWWVRCAVRVGSLENWLKFELVEDLGCRSGTRLVSLLGDEVLHSSVPPRDNITVSPRWGLSGHNYWTINARGMRGFGATATVDGAWLPRANFESCDVLGRQNRQKKIEQALLAVCEKLLDGCIIGNRALDRDVRAFREGHLTRLEVWEGLLAQLENLNLITFRCLDVRDAEWRGGRFVEYSNVIELQWSPSFEPNLPYVILHELLHKAAFNGDLLPFYSESEIEEQAQLVATSCF
jgi:hypothetical protein